MQLGCVRLAYICTLQLVIAYRRAENLITGSLSVRPLYCLAAISTISRQANTSRRRQHSATTLSASKRRCVIVCCNHDFATDSLSVRTSYCPAANPAALCSAVVTDRTVSYVYTSVGGSFRPTAAGDVNNDRLSADRQRPRGSEHVRHFVDNTLTTKRCCYHQISQHRASDENSSVKR